MLFVLKNPAGVPVCAVLSRPPRPEGGLTICDFYDARETSSLAPFGRWAAQASLPELQQALALGLKLSPQHPSMDLSAENVRTLLGFFDALPAGAEAEAPWRRQRARRLSDPQVFDRPMP